MSTPPPIWTRPEPGARKPRFTREQIAQAAIDIADRDGFDAVSMRRVANELGSGTMTLYHYVANKEELVELVSDAIMAELLIPEGEMPDNWRDALAAIARQTRGAFLRHGWMTAQMFEGTTIGPNGLKHFEQSLTAGSLTGLETTHVLEIVSQLDEWVFGFILGQGGGGVEEFDPDDLPEEMFDYLDEQVATGDYPHVAALAAARGGGTSRGVFDWFMEIMGDDGLFERGLQRLLDGIAVDIERRSASA